MRISPKPHRVVFWIIATLCMAARLGSVYASFVVDGRSSAWVCSCLSGRVDLAPAPAPPPRAACPALNPGHIDQPTHTHTCTSTIHTTHNTFGLGSSKSTPQLPTARTVKASSTPRLPSCRPIYSKPWPGSRSPRCSTRWRSLSWSAVAANSKACSEPAGPRAEWASSR